MNIESDPSSGARYTITGKGAGNSKHHIFDYRNDGGTRKFLLQVADGAAGESYSVNHTLSTDTWTHVAVARDASAANAEFFVNGSSIGSGTAGTITSNNNNTNDFRVGANDTPTNFFDGKIDELRFWDVLRTGTEINNNKDKQLTGSETNLQGYWRFNNNLLDQTSNNNDLTGVGSPVFSTSVPFVGETFKPRIIII